MATLSVDLEAIAKRIEGLETAERCRLDDYLRMLEEEMPMNERLTRLTRDDIVRLVGYLDGLT